jgi:hypothetical protein
VLNINFFSSHYYAHITTLSYIFLQKLIQERLWGYYKIPNAVNE